MKKQHLVEYRLFSAVLDPIKFDLSVDMSRSTITVFVECPGDPVRSCLC